MPEKPQQNQLFACGFSQSGLEMSFEKEFVITMTQHYRCYRLVLSPSKGKPSDVRDIISKKDDALQEILDIPGIRSLTINEARNLIGMEADEENYFDILSRAVNILGRVTGGAYSLAFSRHAHVRSAQMLQKDVEAARENGSKLMIAYAQTACANNALWDEDYEKAVEHFTLALEALEGHEEHFGTLEKLYADLGFACSRAGGREDQALEMCRRSETLYKEKIASRGSLDESVKDLYRGLAAVYATMAAVYEHLQEHELCSKMTALACKTLTDCGDAPFGDDQIFHRVLDAYNNEREAGRIKFRMDGDDDDRRRRERNALDNFWKSKMEQALSESENS